LGIAVVINLFRIVIMVKLTQQMGHEFPRFARRS
jgi:hypothetical protein